MAKSSTFFLFFKVCCWFFVCLFFLCLSFFAVLLVYFVSFFWCFHVLPECVARVPASLGGLGVRLCSPSFAFAFATVRNRSQVFATACGDAVRLSTVASASEGAQKLCQVESCRRSYIGVCRGGVCERDLCRRSYIGVCRGGAVRGICVAAVILVSAEEVSVRGICVAAIILVSAEDLSVGVICGAAVISVSAAEVSV